MIVLAISFALPDGFPSQFIPIAYTLGIFYAFKSAQADVVARHTAAGGRVASTWEVVGISLLCLVVIVAIIFGIVIVATPK